MISNDDFLHRIFYMSHIFCVFVTCYYVTNHETHIFSIASSGAGLCWGACLGRIDLAIMYAWAATDKQLEGANREGSTGRAWGAFDKKVLMAHCAILIFSAILFAVAAAVHGAECDHVEHDKCEGNGSHVVVVWNVALLFESVASAALCCFGPAPFDGAYASKRMDAWTMLCFGESVVSLLNTTVPFTNDNLQAELSSFVVLATLCIHYFDVVDAGQVSAWRGVVWRGNLDCQTPDGLQLLSCSVAPARPWALSHALRRNSSHLPQCVQPA